MSFSLDLQIADPRWRKTRGLAARLTQAAELALKRGGAPRRAALTILLTGDAQLRDLNRDFRGKNKPTNVLSFPAPPNADRYLGDVALAFGVTEKEARAAGKRVADHAAHLVVHGVLHLLGFDHVTPKKAREMEPLETRILARLGIADPYEKGGVMAETDSANPSDDADKPQSLLKRLSTFMRGGDAATQMRDSIEEAIEESDRHSAELSAPERQMLSNLLKFGELRVSDVMIPRADIVAADEETSLSDFVALIRDVQHSRLPVYRETLDDPTGLVHIKDVLNYMESQPDGSFRWKAGAVAQFKRKLLFVPPSMPLLDLLLKMQTAHTHLALVIDEYGGTDGLVSIEDIIEEIVGDIADEHDEDVQQVRQVDNGLYVADARIDLDDFREQTGIVLAPEDADQEIDSLGGLVVSLLGRVPQRGEIVTHPSGYEFEVLEADPRRVKRLRVREPQKPAAGPTDGKPA